MKRFWDKVDKSGPVLRPDLGPCWVWTAARTRKGYGAFWLNGKTPPASRVAWEIAQGHPIPPGLCVLHRCDNPSCVNPDHLFLGTSGENCTDRCQKGRNANRREEQNTQARLTEARVNVIRCEYYCGMPQRKIAQIFGVCQQTVSNIITGKTWKHAPVVR